MRLFPSLQCASAHIEIDSGLRSTRHQLAALHALNCRDAKTTHSESELKNPRPRQHQNRNLRGSRSVAPSYAFRFDSLSLFAALAYGAFKNHLRYLCSEMR
jgi:hypothetical protein